MERFKIEILRMHWLEDNGIDDPTDKCIHGEVRLEIDGTVLSNHGNGSWAVSTTALYMLRTRTENRAFKDWESEMLPHCGHFFLPSKDTNSRRVEVMGCGLGIDWSVDHIGRHVIITSEDGLQTSIDSEYYKEQAVNFAKQVQSFYDTSLPKTVDPDEWSQAAYTEFRA